MDRGECFEWHCRAGKFQHDPAARTVSERCEPVAVSAGHSEQDIERSTPNGVHTGGVSHQWHDPSQHRFRVAEERSASMVIHRKSEVAVLGEVVGAAALIVIETDSVMSDEHCRPRTLAVRQRQVGDHRQSVDIVGDFARDNHVITLGNALARE
jgi:hypothetical protein